jgi:hypothetical protein
MTSCVNYKIRQAFDSFGDGGALSLRYPELYNSKLELVPIENHQFWCKDGKILTKRLMTYGGELKDFVRTALQLYHPDKFGTDQHEATVILLAMCPDSNAIEALVNKRLLRFIPQFGVDLVCPSNMRHTIATGYDLLMNNTSGLSFLEFRPISELIFPHMYTIVKRLKKSSPAARTAIENLATNGPMTGFDALKKLKKGNSEPSYHLVSHAWECFLPLVEIFCDIAVKDKQCWESFCSGLRDLGNDVVVSATTPVPTESHQPTPAAAARVSRVRVRTRSQTTPRSSKRLKSTIN